MNVIKSRLYLIKLSMKYISRHRKPYSWSKSRCNWSMIVGCASWISVTVKETCNHVLLVVRFLPFPRGLGWPVLSESSGIFNSPTIWVPKTAIKFQMWGTSCEGAGKHADDPACGIKLPWKTQSCQTLVWWRQTKLKSSKIALYVLLLVVCIHTYFETNLQKDQQI